MVPLTHKRKLLDGRVVYTKGSCSDDFYQQHKTLIKDGIIQAVEFEPDYFRYGDGTTSYSNM